nr:hypothetical protein B0A51_11823 [Rachicladosporium sp. CCFEE 5018]
MHLIAILLGLGLAGASPVPGELAERATTSNFCSTVQSLVTKYSAKSTATAFCSSYLSISTKTVTSTATPFGHDIGHDYAHMLHHVALETHMCRMTGSPADTRSTLTTTATSTTVSTVTATTGTDTSTSTDSNTVTVTALPRCGLATATPVKVKRAISKPACFSSYTASVLSSACSCLSLATPTTTVLVNGAPRIVVSTVTVPATFTAYETSSATASTVTTVNVAATTVSVVRQTVTVDAPPVPSTFFLQAPGLSGYYGRVFPNNGFHFDQSSGVDTLYLDETCSLRLRQSFTPGKLPDSYFITSISRSTSRPPTL